MRICAACDRPIRRHDKYVLLDNKTLRHRNCVTPDEYDGWFYGKSTVRVNPREWMAWLRTGLDPEACGGKP